MIGQDQPARCGLGWAAKVIASGVYLTQRQPLEILRASCAWMTAPDAVMRHALATRDPSAIFALKVEIDHDPIQRMVTLRTAHDGELVSASARFFPDVGACVVDAADPTLKFTPIAHDFAQVADTAPLPPATHLSAAQQAAIDQAGALMFAKAAQFTNAFVVLHRGRTVFERYSPSFGPQTRFESWSMGKSIAASLIGVLEQRGALALAAPTGLAEWQQRGDPRAAIRIADLLNMASGLQFTGSYSDGEDPATKSVDGRFLDHLYVYAGGIDSVGFSLAKPLEAPPGTLGRYRNCDPLLATAVARP
jgi:CubicO group peptidase (beta-lactamase class C family)